jgi:hypothetical protein
MRNLRVMVMAILVSIVGMTSAVAGEPEKAMQGGEAAMKQLDGFRPTFKPAPVAKISSTMDELLAQQSVKIDEKAAPYDKLAALFEASKGKVPLTEDLLGWHTGRCFYSTEPRIPKGSLLIGSMEEDVRGGGPLFAGPVLKLGGVSCDAPDYFDAMDSTTETWALNSAQKNMLKPEFRESGAVLEDVPGSRIDEIRMAGRFLIRTVRSAVANGEGRVENQGSYCYYFKDVTTPKPEAPKPPVKPKK